MGYICIAVFLNTSECLVVVAIF